MVPRTDPISLATSTNSDRVLCYNPILHKLLTVGFLPHPSPETAYGNRRFPLCSVQNLIKSKIWSRFSSFLS